MGRPKGYQRYWNLEDRPCNRDTWVTLFEGRKDHDFWKVGDDEVEVDGKTSHVSTVWLGLNHATENAKSKPLIYETLVSGEEEWMNRYSSRKEAIKGHIRVLKAIREGTLFE
jgi:hypothetical protein